MHYKNIKVIVTKQLKKKLPNWNRLTKKVKKEVAKEVLAELMADYDFNQDVTLPTEELLGIEQQVPAKGIIKLDEMAQYINMVDKSRIVKLSNYERSPSISRMKSCNLSMSCLMTE